MAATSESPVDGRTFVSDGGFAIDAKIAKPAAMPTKVLPRDIPLNGNYVMYLRSVAPQSRLRFKGPEVSYFAPLLASVSSGRPGASAFAQIFSSCA